MIAPMIGRAKNKPHQSRNSFIVLPNPSFIYFNYVLVCENTTFQQSPRALGLSNPHPIKRFAMGGAGVIHEIQYAVVHQRELYEMEV